ncbi:MAG: methylenetetrahydrofolate reductase [Pseudomonadota bacterium]
MTHLPASIEISPKQALESAALPGLFEHGARVYITDVGTHNIDEMVTAVRRVTDLGYTAVPHVAARRLVDAVEFETKLARYAQESGATDILLIGGSPDQQVGSVSSSMEALETGAVDRNGIKNVGIAGHPEGSPDFGPQVEREALSAKQAFANASDAEFRIVTQFGFDATAFIRWADALPSQGIDLPVHIGVAGPAKLPTLIKFAAMCGVGNSLQFLRKNAGKLTALATSHSPEGVVGPIEDHALANPDGPITQLHVFPFGGIAKSADWLRERGSWSAAGTAETNGTAG